MENYLQISKEDLDFVLRRIIRGAKRIQKAQNKMKKKGKKEGEDIRNYYRKQW